MSSARYTCLPAIPTSRDRVKAWHPAKRPCAGAKHGSARAKHGSTRAVEPSTRVVEPSTRAVDPPTRAVEPSTRAKKGPVIAPDRVMSLKNRFSALRQPLQDASGIRTTENLLHAAGGPSPLNLGGRSRFQACFPPTAPRVTVARSKRRWPRQNKEEPCHSKSNAPYAARV